MNNTDTNDGSDVTVSEFVKRDGVPQTTFRHTRQRLARTKKSAMHGSIALICLTLCAAIRWSSILRSVITCAAVADEVN